MEDMAFTRAEFLLDELVTIRGSAQIDLPQFLARTGAIRSQERRSVLTFPRER
jgi:hypothetical protein